FFGRNVAVAQTPRNFQSGVRTFNADLSVGAKVSMPLAAIAQASISRPLDRISLVGQQPSIRTRDVAAAVASLEANPLFNHIEDKIAVVNQTIDAGLSHLDAASRLNTWLSPAAFETAQTSSAA